MRPVDRSTTATLIMAEIRTETTVTAVVRLLPAAAQTLHEIVSHQHAT